MIRIEIKVVMARKGLPERIERAGADVAEHDADRADHQLRRGLLPHMAVTARSFFRRRRSGIGKKISHE